MEGKSVKYVCELKDIDATILLRGTVHSDGKMLSGLGFTYSIEHNRLLMRDTELAVSACTPELAKVVPKVPAVKKAVKAKKVTKVAVERFDDNGNKCISLVPTSYADIFTSWLAKNYEKSNDTKCISYVDMIDTFAKDNCLCIINKNWVGAKSVVTKAVNKIFDMSASCESGYSLVRKQSN